MVGNQRKLMRSLSINAAQELYKKGFCETRHDKTQTKTIKRNVTSSQKHKTNQNNKKWVKLEKIILTSGLILILKLRILIICDSITINRSYEKIQVFAIMRVFISTEWREKEN